MNRDKSCTTFTKLTLKCLNMTMNSFMTTPFICVQTVVCTVLKSRNRSISNFLPSFRCRPRPTQPRSWPAPFSLVPAAEQRGEQSGAMQQNSLTNWNTSKNAGRFCGLTNEFPILRFGTWQHSKAHHTASYTVSRPVPLTNVLSPSLSPIGKKPRSEEGLRLRYQSVQQKKSTILIEEEKKKWMRIAKFNGMK